MEDMHTMNGMDDMDGLDGAYRDVFAWWRQALEREAQLRNEVELLRLLVAVLRST